MTNTILSIFSSSRRLRKNGRQFLVSVYSAAAAHLLQSFSFRNLPNNLRFIQTFGQRLPKSWIRPTPIPVTLIILLFHRAHALPNVRTTRKPRREYWCTTADWIGGCEMCDKTKLVRSPMKTFPNRFGKISLLIIWLTCNIITRIFQSAIPRRLILVVLCTRATVIKTSTILNSTYPKDFSFVFPMRSHRKHFPVNKKKNEILPFRQMRLKTLRLNSKNKTNVTRVNCSCAVKKYYNVQ